MFTNEERMARFRSAPEAIAEIYGSNATTQLIKSIRERFSIQSDVFVDIVGDMILGLYPRNTLPSLLTNELNLSQEIASSIATELNQFLDKIPGEILPSSQQTMSPVSNLISPTTDSEVHRTPLTKDELMKALEAKRTMKTDIDAMREKLKSAAEPKVGYDSSSPQQ